MIVKSELLGYHLHRVEYKCCHFIPILLTMKRGRTTFSFSGRVSVLFYYYCGYCLLCCL